MQLVDTHSHIHSNEYGLDADAVLETGKKAGVSHAIFAGTSVEDSHDAVDFVKTHPGSGWASVGQHPHEANDFTMRDLAQLRSLAEKPEVVAIGECGLDYWYLHSSKDRQREVLAQHVELAVDNNLPLILHVRGSKQQPHDAFSDLWSILASHPNVSGVVHSFSSDIDILKQIVERGLYVGVNGIVTFTKQREQIEAFMSIPIDKLLLETDAPYLTPMPFRGNVNQPAYLLEVNKRVAELMKKEPLMVAESTTVNVQSLFRTHLQ